MKLRKCVVIYVGQEWGEEKERKTASRSRKRKMRGSETKGKGQRRLYTQNCGKPTTIPTTLKKPQSKKGIMILTAVLLGSPKLRDISSKSKKVIHLRWAGKEERGTPSPMSPPSHLKDKGVMTYKTSKQENVFLTHLQSKDAAQAFP